MFRLCIKQRRIVNHKRFFATPTAKIQFDSPYYLHLLETGPPTHYQTSKDELLGFYREMTFMRRMEIAADAAYKAKQIRGFLHLYIGQEAVATGLESAMTPKDHVVTAYRCHANLLSRRCNTDLAAIFAELFGKSTGCSKGKGGSMHLYNLKSHFYGGNGIVGSQVPLGTGVAFSQKMLKTGSVCMTYYGDGAANQGQLFEAYNLAAIWKLPIIFVCENNHYAMGTSIQRSCASTDFYSRASYLPGIKFNGMDVLQSRAVGIFAVEYAKTTGPIVLEAETYRYKGHSMSDPGITYRTRDEVDTVRETRDPIERVLRYLEELGWKDEKELDQITEETKEQVASALKKATEAKPPEIAELFKDVLIEDNFFIRGTEQMHNGHNVANF